MNPFLLLALFSAAVAKVAGIPISGQGAPNIKIVIHCPDKEVWFDCGACDGTCNNLNPVCPMICRGSGGCGCIEGHVRDLKENRCIPKSKCAIVEPAELHPPLLSELHPPRPAELRPPQSVDIHPVDLQPVCPEKEMWFPCGACEGSCSETEPICSRMCQEKGSCGCIKDHVREPKGPRCIHKSECSKVEPAVVRPLPAEISAPACPDKETWFPCGSCDGSCSQIQPICSKMCQSKGGCGCIKDHVREPKGHECIHMSHCAILDPIFPRQID